MGLMGYCGGWAASWLMADSDLASTWAVAAMTGDGGWYEAKRAKTEWLEW